MTLIKSFQAFQKMYYPDIVEMERYPFDAIRMKNRTRETQAIFFFKESAKSMSISIPAEMLEEAKKCGESEVHGIGGGTLVMGLADGSYYMFSVAEIERNATEKANGTVRFPIGVGRKVGAPIPDDGLFEHPVGKVLKQQYDPERIR